MPHNRHPTRRPDKRSAIRHLYPSPDGGDALSGLRNCIFGTVPFCRMAALPYPAYETASSARCQCTTRRPDKRSAIRHLHPLPDGGDALSGLRNTAIRHYHPLPDGGVALSGLRNTAIRHYHPSPDGGVALSGLHNSFGYGIIASTYATASRSALPPGLKCRAINA